MLKVFSQSLGCPKNLVDTEHVLGSWGKFNLVEDFEDADVIFINTCAFIASAVKESIETIIEIVSNVDTEHKFIIVCGCLAGRYSQEELNKEIPEVDLWLETKDIDYWGFLSAKAIQDYFQISLIKEDLLVEFSTPEPIIDHEIINGKKNIYLPPAKRMLSTGPSYAWLKISEGCKNKCSFCTIPSIRGKYRSLPLDNLVSEAKILVEEENVKELILVAQDVSAYGTDLNGKDLRILLDKLFSLNGLARLRLMYLYPSGMTKELLKYLAEAGSLFMPYFDIPLQHFHPDILSKMGRPFAQNPEIITDRIRHYFPNAALRTTFIVGFPGETDEHFSELYGFVNRARFQQMGVFAYEQEDNTLAATMPNQIDYAIKQERRDELMALQAEISEEILESYVGQNMEILVDGIHPEWDNLYIGRAWFQAPDVDGITYLSIDPELELENKQKKIVGSVFEAQIQESQEYDLVALV